MILVIGATGQLGAAVVNQLVLSGQSVKAFIRKESNYTHLKKNGVKLCFGDLKDIESLESACHGVDVVISTATVVFPRGKYSFELDERNGYKNIINVCKKYKIKQLIFISIVAPFINKYTSKVPTLCLKQNIEDMIVSSGINYTIFRSAPFMDDYYVLIGSDIPLRDAEAATLRRPFWFSRFFIKNNSKLIEHKGLASIPGNPDKKHNFISIANVASFLVNSINKPEAMNRLFEIGGKQSESWREIVQIYAKLLNRKVRILSTPGWIYRIALSIFKHFSKAASNQLGILWVLSENETCFDSENIADLFDVSIETSEQFLRDKMSNRLS